MNIGNLDYSWFEWINSKADHNAFLDHIMIFFADYLQYAFALLLVVLFLINRNYSRVIAMQAGFALVLGFAVNRVIRFFFFRDRPFVSHKVNQLVEHSPSSSFPSDHATAAFAIAFTIILCSISTRYIWGILAIGISFSRVWVGVHYPLDIMAGALNGIIMASFTHYIIFKLKPLNPIFENTFFSGRSTTRNF
jgi:undecaprenyl-diphosphatase